MDWKECTEKRIAKKISTDTDLIRSLIKNSSNKLKSSEQLNINKITISSKISLAHDSLRELLEALSVKKGFKIYNHECYTAFLKEILNEPEKAENFDEIRKIRNKINYYGKEINFEDAEKIIKKIKNLRKLVLEMIKI